jgi:hypothetical protein
MKPHGGLWALVGMATGKWEDGTAFEAYNSIRVIAP